MVVDMQVHLWEAERPDRPHQPVFAFRREPYTVEDMLPEMATAGVERVVIVPPALMGYDNRYGLECAARWPDRFAVMGRFNPLAPDALERLETWLDQPGMKGIRLPFHPDEKKRWPSPDALDPFFAAAERLGIPLALFASEALDGVAPVAAKHPGLTLIVDHFGLPRVGVAADDHYDLNELLALATYPNIAVKASAVSLHSREAYPYRDLWPVLKAAYEAFGPERLLWGSDWTQTLTFNKGTYRQDVDWLREAVDFIPAAEKALILGGNALRLLKWDA